MSIKITFIYQADPFGKKVGGIETFTKGFIKYAPEDFDIEFIGITSDRDKRPPKKWISLCLGKKKFNFFPLFYEKNENKKTLIPLSLRFTLALKFSRITVEQRTLIFNRIEPALLFKNAKVPKIAVIHSDIQGQILQKKSELLWSKFPQIYFKFENYVLNFMDHVFTVNESTLKFYLQKYSEYKNKFSFLPTWVDTGIFYSIEKSKDFLKKTILSQYDFLPIDGPWILFAGRLQETKAPFRLVDVFLEYYKKNKSGYLFIIGEGNLKNKLIEYVKTIKLEINIFFFGQMEQEFLVSFYRASDVLILTSNSEGMPICVLEALSCGLPVVTTDVGEVKRVVRNNFSGEVVNSFDPKSIANGLEKVLNNPTVYTKENCMSCISEYIPQKVLQPAYELIKKF